MGVALRIDKALAVEAGSSRGGVGLAPAPDWDELMRDSPWEKTAATVSASISAPTSVSASSAEQPSPEPVRLGVVADDGTIVPARQRRARRSRWAMPAVAAAAAAAVVGTAVVSTGLLASGGGGGAGTVSPPVVAASTAPAVPPTQNRTRARAYALTDSQHNYSDENLEQPLGEFLGPAPILQGPSDGEHADKCVSKLAGRTKLDVFAVDQGQYNGQEAIVMASRKTKAAKRIRIDVVDPFSCKNLRKPAMGRW
ncbi:hypothetical protein [Nonomuraea sp. SBT364]|uniref:hypothetical protein n=1 Tax=Nonomuraea sp. SBT364 TaxID=1580530 RepID=UPI001E47C664|nr:hypothetical protein [Nonomuraea sp. SBT364]